MPNLNADRVDSLDSTRLARVVQVGTVTSPGFVFDPGTPGDDSDDVLVAVAECPAGSQVMGGGGDDFTADGVLASTSPDTGAGLPDAWLVISTADPATADTEDVVAYARCWNPTASVGDSTQRTTNRKISAPTTQLARKVAANR